MHEMVDVGCALAQDYGTSAAMEKTLMENSATAIETVGLLVGAIQSDTSYRDVYLRRARDLLSSTLDQSHYQSIGSIQKETLST